MKKLIILMILINILMGDSVNTYANSFVIDKKTGLIWLKKDTLYNSRFNSAYNRDSSLKTYKETIKSYEEAKEICKNFSIKGIENWRLPSKNEIKFALLFKHYIFGGDYIFWLNNKGTFRFGDLAGINVKYKNKKGPEKYLYTCVSGGIKNNILFNSYNDLRLSNSIFPLKSNMIVYVENKAGTLNDHLYTKNTFPEIKRLTQELVNLYLEPRKIKKPEVPKKIAEPTLPKLPKLVKDQFETKKMFQDRVSKAIEKRDLEIKRLQAKYREDVENRNKKVQTLMANYEAEVQEVKSEQKLKKELLPEKIKQFQKGAFRTVMGDFKFQNPKYDAESQTMYVTMKAERADYSKKVKLDVPISVAKSFHENVKNVKALPTFDFSNNAITLKSINANYQSSKYLAKLTNTDFKPENMRFDIKDEKVEFASAKQMKLILQNPNLKDTYQVGGMLYKDGKQIKGIKYNDDIPELLKKAKKEPKDSKKWLITIGIENYDETDNITFAKRSALAFKQVAKKTLGIKERNCYTLIDDKATSGRIKSKLKLLLSEVKKGDTIYFYYNGHGIPVAVQNNEPYMLPSDIIPDFIASEKEFALKNIYKSLTDSKASKVVAFVDSCFSGATDGVSVMKGVAGSKLVSKKVSFDKSKMAVITAGQKKQYSNMYQDKGHRLFSYYMMKSLLKGKKDISDIFKEVSYKVSETSNEFGALKKQEPTFDGNSKIKL